MKITDTTDDRIIAHNAKWADTFLSRLQGLMFKKIISEMDGLILAPCNSIHTHFMRFSINVVILNKDRIVIRQIFIKPWKVYGPVKDAYYIIELPEDSYIKGTNLIGHRVKIEE